MRSTFQIYINYSDRFAWRSTLSPAMARADGGAADNARQPFRGGGGAAGNARQPFRGGRRHRLCRQSALWLEHWWGLRAQLPPGARACPARHTAHRLPELPSPWCTVLMRGRRPPPIPPLHIRAGGTTVLKYNLTRGNGKQLPTRGVHVT